MIKKKNLALTLTYFVLFIVFLCLISMSALFSTSLLADSGGSGSETKECKINVNTGGLYNVDIKKGHTLAFSYVYKKIDGSEGEMPDDCYVESLNISSSVPDIIPSFMMYADKDNMYGTKENEDLLDSKGITAKYYGRNGDILGKWTFDFGIDITNQLLPEGVGTKTIAFNINVNISNGVSKRSVITLVLHRPSYKPPKEDKNPVPPKATPPKKHSPSTNQVPNDEPTEEQSSSSFIPNDKAFKETSGQNSKSAATTQSDNKSNKPKPDTGDGGKGESGFVTVGSEKGSKPDSWSDDSKKLHKVDNGNEDQQNPWKIVFKMLIYFLLAIFIIVAIFVIYMYIDKRKYKKAVEADRKADSGENNNDTSN